MSSVELCVMSPKLKKEKSGTMAKVMLFIDGTWLYANTRRLGEHYGKQEYHVSFGKLPQVLAEEVGKQMALTDVDVVRTYLYGSYASNYNLQDDEAVQARLEFFARLKEEYHYEVEIFPINFMGRRVRKADRDLNDAFQPKEKCVDVALATSMLYFAAIPYAYDIAVAVVGDGDFSPVLQHVRRLGKRVAIASIKGSCCREFADPRDEARVKDFDIIWLDDLLDRLELKYERHQLLCESPRHKGDKKVWTAYHPGKGETFYCEECKKQYARQKQELQQEFVSSEIEAVDDAEVLETSPLGRTLAGKIARKREDKGFGFIRAGDGKDYFFHLTDLEPDLEFDSLEVETEVDFEVKKKPSDEKAGAAENVRPHNA